MARVLLVRLDGIGDALVCVPLVAALRAAGHSVSVVVSDRNAGTFASRAVAAELALTRIPWPRHGSTAESRAQLSAHFERVPYDVALIASEEPEAYRLVRHIPERVGFTTGWEKPLKSAWVSRQLTRAIGRRATERAHREHEVETMFRLGSGLLAADAEPARDAPTLRSVVRDTPRPMRSGIVMQLGAKWGDIGVDAATLQTLVSSLAERGARFLVAPHERAAVAAALPAAALIAPPTLAAWFDEIDFAAALVTMDSGAAHVGGMLGVPVVDVFADRAFVANARRWRPWAATSIVLRASQVVRAPSAVVAAALDAL